MIHFQGILLKFVLLPSKKGSTLKGKNLLLSGQILLFEVDIFSEGIWYTGKQMGNHKKIFLLSKMFKKISTRCIHSSSNPMRNTALNENQRSRGQVE